MKNVAMALGCALLLAGCAGCAPTAPPPPPEDPPLTYEGLPLPPGAIVDPAGVPPAGEFSSADFDWPGSLAPLEEEDGIGGALHKIRERGRLLVGIDQSQYLLSYRDTAVGELRGFEVDLAHEIAKDILGDPEKVDFRFVESASRAEMLQSGAVDVVIRTMSITQERAQKVAFSTPYMSSYVRVLTPRDRGIDTIEQLAGKRVCIVDGTNLLNLTRTVAPESEVLRTRSWSDCLMATQQFQADAVLADDAILAGMTAQDPHAEILPDSLARQLYAVGIPKGHDDLVRAVNSTIERIRNDGTWTRMHQQWLGDSLADPTPPPVMYREEEQ
ncbi:glutamate ABC transporter substrate-binding protein [Corynebacterium imitans]|uniref:glutamate ABC transporter substrate-binding protein n=1 Tax=Corynebacterium imitans TaxID=156978 RepID=UPI00254D6208|nr:glutamate ABC transporter substrate-binding protein [Corynebacterium imitans]MDK8307339.1 glutamate ABC transporter substrate-binding protein [Corynebacterium imitans]MDK8638486.1 glutamate ABC transporter substrate-binding protein [Corynebacterium imitans]MDK8773704.1 glutamate ABC transporter substrate-binding protein [Corynebacterium imitans]